MFDNIGGKIKTLAVVICVIGMIGSVIGGFVLIVSDDDMILPGLIMVALGCLGSWVGSFFTYGFGELIENTARIADNTSRMGSNQGSAPTARTTPVTPVNQPRPVVSSGTTAGSFWRCKCCGTSNKSTDVFCRDCGTYK